jgi:hypothetical protein
MIDFIRKPTLNPAGEYSLGGKSNLSKANFDGSSMS